MINDVNAMVLGEFLYGAGRGVQDMIGMTLGTGVGGGLVIDGLVHGGQPAAGEIGHLRPGLQAATAKETVESVSSGWGIANTARNRLRRGGAEAERVARLPHAAPVGRHRLHRRRGAWQLENVLLARRAVAPSGTAAF